MFCNLPQHHNCCATYAACDQINLTNFFLSHVCVRVHIHSILLSSFLGLAMRCATSIIANGDQNRSAESLSGLQDTSRAADKSADISVKVIDVEIDCKVQCWSVAE